MNESALYPGWETVREIGSGSFGAVYEIARTLPNGKTEKAALKVISIPQNEGDVEELYSSGYDDASITAHFKSYLADIVNEYSLMAEIKGHTNVVYCDDIRYIQHDDGFGWDIFIKMELLTPLMKAKEPGAVEDTVKKLGADICSALVLCREKNIIHRDIKPQNIFVSEHGDYKLGDFGIAKTVEKTTGGTKIGTYGYMAPEVYNNQPYGAAADIYSLGLVLYWLLNEHRLPFLPMPPKVPTSTENEQARLRRFRGEPIPAPKNGSEALKRIVLKACAYDPGDRYHTADEMLADLNALQGSPAAAPEETAPAAEAEAPEDAETATRGAFTVGTTGTAAPALDAEKTEGTVGIFDREPERAEVKPQKKTPGKTGKPGSKKLYAAILGGILVAAVAVLALTQGGKKTSQTAKASGKTGTVTTVATEPKTASIPFSTEIGSTVEFGHYEQDAVTSNGPEPIEWYVISKDEDTNMLLLLSKDGLDNVPYNRENAEISWAECNLREWLNSEEGFWGTAFTDEEKLQVGNTRCITSDVNLTDNMLVSDVFNREETSDKVFLLSFEDVQEYGDGNPDWLAFSMTPYALAQANQDGVCLLRNVVKSQSCVITALLGGDFASMSMDGLWGLRPAVWVAADGAEAPADATYHIQKTVYPDVILDECKEAFPDLLNVARSWTEETAPQTIAEFPLFTQSYFELFDVVNGATSETEISKTRVTWKTNLLKHFALKQPIGASVEGSLGYRNENGDYKLIDFERINDSSEFSCDKPEDFESNDSQDLTLSVEQNGKSCDARLEVQYHSYSINLSYSSFVNRINEKPEVCINVDNRYSDSDLRGFLSWYCDIENGRYRVYIDWWDNGRLNLCYDMATGELIEYEKK